MEKLNNQQLSKIDEYLKEQGLTFDPLRVEMTDHLIADLENRIIAGRSFEEAWMAVTGVLPNGHFQNIQMETMESLEKNFNWTKIFSVASLGLLLMATLFKLMHFPGTAFLLFAFFGAMMFSLSTGGYYGIKLNREKTGRQILIALIVGMVLYLAAWSSQVLNIVNTSWLRVFVAGYLIILFSYMTLFYMNNEKSKSGLLAYLHREHSVGINRYLLILLFFGAVLKMSALLGHYTPAVANVILVLVIAAGGVQFFVANMISNDAAGVANSAWFKVLMIAAVVCFFTIMTGSVLSAELRVMLAMVFILLAGVIVNVRKSDTTPKLYVIALTVFIVLIMTHWTMVKTGVLAMSTQGMVFNLPVLLLLITGYFFVNKNLIVKIYYIMFLAIYLFELPFLIPSFL